VTPCLDRVDIPSGACASFWRCVIFSKLELTLVGQISISLTPAGGTRFIGVYLARQLVEQGHDVTLLTRGKSPVTQQIPDDTDDSFAKYEAAVKHIACDRKDADAMKEKLSGAGFQGVACWS